jgi:hypothetical protein
MTLTIEKKTINQIHLNNTEHIKLVVLKDEVWCEIIESKIDTTPPV